MRKKYLMNLLVVPLLGLPILSTISCNNAKNASEAQGEKKWDKIVNNWMVLDGVKDKSGKIKIKAKYKSTANAILNAWKNTDEVEFKAAWPFKSTGNGNKYGVYKETAKLNIYRNKTIKPEDRAAELEKEMKNIKNKFPNGMPCPDFKGVAKIMYVFSKGQKLNKSQKEKDKDMKTVFWNMNQIYNRKQIQAPPAQGGWQRLPLVRAAVSNFGGLFANNYIVEKDKEIKKQIIEISTEVLNEVSEKFYFDGQKEYVNWWHYEIGMPKTLLNFIFKIQNGLTSKQLKKYMAAYNYFKPDPLYGHASKGAINNYRPTNKMLSTGGNLADNVLNAVKASILSRDGNKIIESINKLYKYSIESYVKTNDGFYRDGGFIQHGNIGYMGGYGAVTMGSLANVALLLKDSEFDIFKLEPGFKKIFNIAERTIFPFMYRGAFSLTLNGRGVSRGGDGYKEKVKTNQSGKRPNNSGISNVAAKKGNSEVWVNGHGFGSGPDLLEALSKLETYATGKEKQRLDNFLTQQITQGKLYSIYKKQYFKKWEGNKFKDIVDYESDYGLKGLRQIWSQDRIVKKTENYMLNVAVHSNRTGNFESMGGENLQGFYDGDGLMLIQTKENIAAYNGNYWWGIDPYFKPGTTSIVPEKENNLYVGSDQKAIGSNDKWRNFMDHSSQTVTNGYAGGTIMGEYGSSFADFQNFDKTLSVRKSYFNIDNQLLVLGSINRFGNNVVATIDNRMSENGSYSSGPISNTENNKYIYHDSKNKESIGYVVYNNTAESSTEVSQRTPFQTNRSLRNKKYKGIVNKVVNKKFNKLVLSNKEAKDKQFAYGVFPGVTVENVSAWKPSDNVKIIRNDNNVQAIQYINDKNEEYLMMNFISLKSTLETHYFAMDDPLTGVPKKISITPSAPCSIIIKKGANGKYSFSARSADYNKSKLSIKFGNSIKSINTYGNEENDASYSTDSNIDYSLDNWNNYKTYVEKKGQFIYNEWYEDPQTIVINFDARYKYNRSSHFELEFNN